MFAGGAGGLSTTGRYLVVMRQEQVRAAVAVLSEDVGLNVARASDFDDWAASADDLAQADGVVFDDLAVAVVNAPPEEIRTLEAASAKAGSVLSVEPERIVYASESGPMGAYPYGAPGLSAEYLRGYRDAVEHLAGRATSAPAASDPAEYIVAAASGEDELTWGLQAIGAVSCPGTGRGVRVAILDTGLDLEHPDFKERPVSGQSFVAGGTAQDGHGHGTHCAGTACGPRQAGHSPGHGVAPEAEIFVGKVLEDDATGADGDVIAGIEWAVVNGCQVVCLSLGAPVLPGTPFSSAFEVAARRALERGTLIVAAAGNGSYRPAFVRPVEHPANCPSIMAVAALDARLAVASFSNGGTNLDGGQVDLAAPGVNVLSSWPRPTLHARQNGTSMAAPHVAGVAALHAEADPKARGRALMSILTQNARRLTLPSRDVGAGLVQAPPAVPVAGV